MRLYIKRLEREEAGDNGCDEGEEPSHQERAVKNEQGRDSGGGGNPFARFLAGLQWVFGMGCRDDKPAEPEIGRTGTFADLCADDEECGDGDGGDEGKAA